MTKKEKLYVLIFSLSCLSILVSIPLKLIGIKLFGINIFPIFFPSNLEYTLNNILSMIQFYLIIGCVTFYEPKNMLIKILPYLPLTILINSFSLNNTYLFCLILLLVTCMSLKPKFSTFISFLLNIFLISILQMILIWVKLDVSFFSPVFPSFINIVLYHIDEFIMLGFLYFLNRKWGEKFAQLVIYRRNGQ